MSNRAVLRLAVIGVHVVFLAAATSAAGAERLSSKPKLRNYACLHQSQAYTGFGEPPLRFRLKRREWLDRTTAKRVTARWTWKNDLATLYSKKGRRLYRFAHFEDSRGRYLVEHPRGSDPLICR